jgi:hypothetical protein
MRFVSVAVILTLAGCVSGTPPAPVSAPAPVAAPAPLMDESVPQVARDACLREVGRVTANPDLAITEMIYSEANSQVTVGVGPDRAPWRCLVSREGIVAEVMSLTDEGAL